MTTKMKTVDWGGLTLELGTLKLGSTGPGQAGTEVTATAAEINLAADISARGPVLIPDETTYTVLAVNSGLVHVFPDLTASCTATLPAASAGLAYEFWYGGAAADAANWVIVPTAGFFIGGLVFHDQDGDVSSTVFSDGDSNDVMTIKVPEAGTCIKLLSDGTNWYLNGWVHAATVPTIADS